MNRIRTAIEKAQNTMTDIGAKAMVAATNAAGRAMNTKLGRAALVVPAAVSMCTFNVHAAGDGADAQGMIDAIMGVLGPGVVRLLPWSAAFRRVLASRTIMRTVRPEDSRHL